MVQLYAPTRRVAPEDSSLRRQDDALDREMMMSSFDRSVIDHLPAHTDLKLALLPAELVDSS